VMQPCFFALSGVLPAGEAIDHIKKAVEKAYGTRGRAIVERNFTAIDASVAALQRVEVPTAVTATARRTQAIPDDASDFVKRVISMLMAGDGDLLPVSALPVDGVFPTGTAKYEKRSIAQEIPIFDPEICIDCGRCAAVCPHATIRMKVYDPVDLAGAPAGFRSKAFRSKDVSGMAMTIQVAPDDCTGCGVCVDVCPAKSKSEVRHKAINMEPAAAHREIERQSWDYFLTLPEIDRDALPHDSVKGAQALQPLFEFSGACAGCGETPYIKLATQLFGDRMIVANATGCSSIYGGNLPTTPWTTNAEGRGPAWSNSLFEDNAEFGLGLRLGLEVQQAQARLLVAQLAPVIGADLATEILDADQSAESGIRAQRERVARLHTLLRTIADTDEHRTAAIHLASVADELVSKGVWIIGGDGWAYDIGFGGLDHVLSSGRDVNILVLDTEVYSNTGGQASKATPRGAVAKFAAVGKSIGKKDLGAIARAYGNVYVAQIAIGANDTQATKALVEAAAWPGPSLVIAYSTCIAHGIDMSQSMTHMKDAVRSGYWPLYRFSPSHTEDVTPFHLDSKVPAIPVAEFTATEARFAALARTHPERAAKLAALLQADADERWRYYSQLATIERTVPRAPVADAADVDATEGSAP
jgi:pyruvate-ferredoxin/flavodoxin oxidoreductase